MNDPQRNGSEPATTVVVPRRHIVALVLLAASLVAVAAVVLRLEHVMELTAVAATDALLPLPLRRWLARGLPDGAAALAVAVVTFISITGMVALVARDLASQLENVQAAVNEEVAGPPVASR